MSVPFSFRAPRTPFAALRPAERLVSIEPAAITVIKAGDFEGAKQRAGEEGPEEEEQPQEDRAAIAR